MTIVYFVTVEKKVYAGKLIEKYEDGSVLVQILKDENGEDVKHKVFSLVIPKEVKDV